MKLEVYPVSSAMFGSDDLHQYNSDTLFLDRNVADENGLLSQMKNVEQIAHARKFYNIAIKT